MLVSRENKIGFRFKTMRKNETFRTMVCAIGNSCGRNNRTMQKWLLVKCVLSPTAFQADNGLCF
jgi:hypothetical protein